VLDFLARKFLAISETLLTFSIQPVFSFLFRFCCHKTPLRYFG